jgi:diaminopimelate decarboxylase
VADTPWPHDRACQYGCGSALQSSAPHGREGRVTVASTKVLVFPERAISDQRPSVVLWEVTLDPIDLKLLPCTTAVGDDGQLTIGGVRLVDMAREFGTPLFVYDEEAIKANFDTAYRLFGDGVAYSSKAFLCKTIARLAYSRGLSIDVATAGEYHICREAGVPSQKLIFHGNNKAREAVQRAVSEGVQWIVIDGFDDLALVSSIANQLQRRTRVLVRVNPGVEVHTHRFNATGNRGSKFGFPLWTGDAVSALAAIRRERWLELVGVHIHVGSLVFSIDTFLAALDSVVELVASVDAEVFVVGGGLGVRYLNSDTAPSLDEWAGRIIEKCRNRGIRSRVLAELGRSMVASAGITLYSVGSITKKDSTTFVAVDGGMSDNPRPLLYESGYEVFLVREPLSRREKVVTVVGQHCESGDTLVKDGYLPESSMIGDLVCTPVTGAYGYTMASNYQRVLRPAVVFVTQGSARLVIRRETYADITSCDLG